MVDNLKLTGSHQLLVRTEDYFRRLPGRLNPLGSDLLRRGHGGRGEEAAAHHRRLHNLPHSCPKADQGPCSPFYIEPGSYSL